MLDTIKFIKEHENWKDILSKPPYCITIKEDNNYYLLKYSQIDSDFSYSICRECRGLIVDKATLMPVALSFKKFFNYCEKYADTIDWATAKVQEKIDGSKILLFWDKYHNQWRVCTSGTLDAYQTALNGSHWTFGQLFDRAIMHMGLDRETWMNKALDPKYCYTFELVSLENRIVVPYKDTKIYLIGQRDIESWEECTPDYGIAYRPNQYNLNSLNQCLEAVAKMGYDQEGFVVVDNNWNRVKIKSLKYLEVFYLACTKGTSLEQIINSILANEQEEFLSYFPEYKEKFHYIENKINEFIYSIQLEYDKLISCNFASQKELAYSVNTNFKNHSDVLFRAIRSNTQNIRDFCLDYLRDVSYKRKMSLLNIQNH